MDHRVRKTTGTEINYIVKAEAVLVPRILREYSGVVKKSTVDALLRKA